ncbi:MAG TPA: sulfite exporter TauE/SafE family protein [Miltoncostaeaceae bacterium]|nr:sulfite exporter TauE/SafE family protein [Miltoncostaeaceae bacterium]
MSPVEIGEVAALGVLAGMLAGIFGVGGGGIFVPALTLVLGLAQLEAEATSLLAIVPVAILGSWRNHQEGGVRWRDALIMGLASIATAVLGTWLADLSPDRVLRIGFAVLLVITAVRMTLHTRSLQRMRRGEE